MKLIVALATAALLTAPSIAAPCRNAAGKFIACPKAAPVAKKCRDDKGHFAKCGTPGAKPA